MWRVFTRVVREPLERKLALKKKEKCENNQAKESLHSGCIVPSCLRNFSLCFQHSKTDKSGNASSRKTDNPKERWRYSFKIKDHHSWIEAFGWTSALAFGWILSQHVGRYQKEIDDKFLKYRNKPYIKHKPFQAGICTLLAHPVNNEQNVETTDAASNCSSYSNGNNSTEAVCYGSKEDIQQAFARVNGELVNAHNETVAEIENQTGVRFFRQKKYKKAMKHFSTAAALRHSDAMFNLAQCYEVGRGAKKDFKKAAKYYEKASGLGHAGAMYNLGVFYAHGWGGLHLDYRQAETLFAKAAALGQEDAIAALETAAQKNPSFPNRELNSRESSLKNSEFETSSNNNLSKDYSIHNVTSIMKKSGVFSINADLHSAEFSGTNNSKDLFYPEESTENFAGICFENGIGVKQDIEKAMDLYSKAAFNGNSTALCNLASSFEWTLPFSSSTDMEMMMVFYKMAASRGNKYAEEKIKNLELYHAFGILPDYLKSRRIHYV